ncbi:hypothetical protein PMIN03_002804 [Paraphaeosphaeria minitans]
MLRVFRQHHASPFLHPFSEHFVVGSDPQQFHVVEVETRPRFSIKLPFLETIVHNKVHCLKHFRLDILDAIFLALTGEVRTATHHQQPTFVAQSSELSQERPFGNSDSHSSFLGSPGQSRSAELLQPWVVCA